ncbi:MAG TPA: peptide chain release factor N(5)-glutamine methyltransferase [Planctomycetaceae bacterium]|nr:peptide chain release factor N(5)-glutamine methyltransferase [Planctomycetaceae bacterium]
MSQPQQSDVDVWTVGRIIDWTTQHLKKHGSETPRLDAEILLAHARGCPRIQLYVDYAAPLTDAQRASMREFVQRRAQAEPVAYLVGKREFFGLDFRVTPDVLIPRPETETLVLELVTAARKRAGINANGEPAPPESDSGPAASGHLAPLRILDLCTGSGCIAVASAVNLPDAQVTAIDISAPALAIARQNAEAHRVAQRIRFLAGDLFAPLKPDEQFEFIVSNPPYVADGEMATLPADIRKHEPHLALQAGPRGLDVIVRLIAGVPGHLAPGGLLLIEFSPEQTPAVTELTTAEDSLELLRVLKDVAGKPRALLARRRM